MPMIRSALLFVVLSVFLSVGSACRLGDVEVDLGQQFSLAIGQKARITNENLEISFKEISEDSRCARDVTCIWEGRVVCLLEMTKDDVLHQITLIQPGLTEQPVQKFYHGYIFTFNVEPYPEKAAKQIRNSEYRLFLTMTPSSLP